MIKQLANIITISRFISTCIMIFVPSFSRRFYIVYTYSGISDALDGYVARKTNTSSKFGSILDSISDLFFYIVMFIKIFPELFDSLPKKVLIIVNIILILRLFLYLYFGIFKHSFLSNHTILNKFTGLLIFLIPFVINSSLFSYYSYLVSIISIFAAVYELHLVFVNNKN